MLRNAALDLRRRIIARSGPLARAVLFPRVWARPWQGPRLDVARDSGIGDVLMCTPALRAARRANPRLRIRLYTDFPELVRGLPYIDEVLPFEAREPGSIFVEYTKVVPSSAHIARLLGDRIGVNVTDTQPDCVVDARLVEQYRARWRHLPRPWVVALRRASRFTPNKDWPAANWDALAARIAERFTLVEVGEPDVHGAAPEGHYVDLRGATSVSELVAVLAAADAYVGPVSGPMHIAAAVGTRAVVIIGGYEHPVNAHYAGNVEFYTPVACAPCWLRTPCPFDVACLRAISVDVVWRAIGA